MVTPSRLLPAPISVEQEQEHVTRAAIVPLLVSSGRTTMSIHSNS